MSISGHPLRERKTVTLPVDGSKTVPRDTSQNRKKRVDRSYGTGPSPSRPNGCILVGSSRKTSLLLQSPRRRFDINVSFVHQK